ncbi:MAG: hypothetical protein J6Y16_11315 [Treponema sp.]|nr:hypothetical protein [Treponema sp.]
MDFKDFRNNLEKEFKQKGIYSINYPSYQTDNYFWIAIENSFISTTLCHYEFVLDEKNKSMVNLEIHFEFFSENKFEDEKNAFSLQGKYLLNDKITKLHCTDGSPNQVGIIYQSFTLDSDNLIEKSISSLDEMNSKFLSAFSYFIKDSPQRNTFKKNKFVELFERIWKQGGKNK